MTKKVLKDMAEKEFIELLKDDTKTLILPEKQRNDGWVALCIRLDMDLQSNAINWHKIRMRRNLNKRKGKNSGVLFCQQFDVLMRKRHKKSPRS